MAEKSLLPAKGSSLGLQLCPSPQGIPQLRRQHLRKLPRRLLHQSNAKEAHRRQISQAIPRNKRDNGELLGLKWRQPAQDLLGKAPEKALEGKPNRAVGITTIAFVHVNYYSILSH